METDPISITEFLGTLRRKWRFPVALTICLLVISIFPLLTMKPDYEATLLLLIDTGSSGDIYAPNTMMGDLQGLTRARNVETQRGILLSDPVMERLREKLKSKGLHLNEDLHDCIQVKSDQDSDILEVTAITHDPNLSATTANLLGDEFISYTKEQSRNNLKDTLQRLVNKSRETQKEIEETKTQIRQIKSNLGISDPPEELKEIRNRKMDLEKQKDFLKQQLSLLTNQTVGLKKQLRRESPFRESTRTYQINPELTHLKILKNEKELELRRLSEICTDQNPKVILCKQELFQLNNTLQNLQKQSINRKEYQLNSTTIDTNSDYINHANTLRDLSAQVIANKQNLQNLNDQITQTQYDIQALVFAEDKISKLTELISIDSETYDLEMRHTHDIGVRLALEYNPIKVLQPAEKPKGSFRFHPKLIMLAVFTFGPILGIFWAMTLEKKDPYLDTVHAVVELLHSPIFGLIPFREKKHPNILGKAYQGIHSRILELCEVDNHKFPHSISIFAPESNSQTADFARNLSLEMARESKQILLVDADFQRHELTEIMGGLNRPGLSDIILHRGNPSKWIVETAQENLKFLPAGFIGVNSQEWFCTEHFEDILSNLKDQCDCLILALPPCLLVPTTFPAAAKTDLVLLHISLSKISSKEALIAWNHLQSAGVSFCGVVLSNVKDRDIFAKIKEYYRD